MRILFATTRGAGHVGPLIPFAHACRRAGHDVLIVAPRSAWQHVARAKLPFSGVEDPDEDVLAPVWDRVRAAPPGERQDRIVISEIFADAFARAALPGMLSVIGLWRPQIIVRETVEYASLLAAEALGVPEAHVSCFLTVTDPHGWGVDAPLARLREEFGLTARERADGPYLTFAPRSLENPDRPPAPDTHRFRVPGPGRPAPLPDRWGGADAPLVYVSFGSAAAGNGFFPTVYRGAVDALAEEPVRVLMTLGTEVDPFDLGPVPENVHLERWVPQAAVMPHAAAMVGHGGSGSTLMAMAAGLPLAVVPLFADQPINAARVAALGAGIALDGVGELATAVRALLTVPAYRASARAVAAEIAAHPPIEKVVPLLRSIAGTDALAA